MKFPLLITACLFVSASFGQDTGAKGIVVKEKNSAGTTVRFRCAAGASSGKQPLIILDGIAIDFTQVQKLDTKNILSITVLKDKAAIERFGRNAKHGVILITSKCEEVQPAL